MKPTLTPSSEHVYSFAAARGIQFKPYFNINVPARVLVKLLRIDDAGSTMDALNVRLTNVVPMHSLTISLIICLMIPALLFPQ
ncbi:hypothetical protein ACP3W9_05525 [Vibrio anguillarum]